MREDEILSVESPQKDKCECAKCLYGLFGGWDNWKCAKFPNGKPNGVLYNGDKCPEFVSAEADEEENDMDADEKIRKLLKAYGASDTEIENFMNDLNDETEEKPEKKEEKAKTDVYKSLREKGGSDLIIKLGSMSKEEREKAIKDYLNN